MIKIFSHWRLEPVYDYALRVRSQIGAIIFDAIFFDVTYTF